MVSEMAIPIYRFTSHMDSVGKVHRNAAKALVRSVFMKYLLI